MHFTNYIYFNIFSRLHIAAAEKKLILNRKNLQHKWYNKHGLKIKKEIADNH